MNALFRIGLALALPSCIAACAAPATPTVPTVPTAVVSQEGIRTIPARSAQGAATIGRSRAELVATLGETLVIGFDNGYEVWVYRLASDRKETPRDASAELVILFAPSGLVAKTRIRPAPFT